MISTCHKQRGLVTLFVTSVLLFLVTSASFYSADALIMEQRMASNSLQSEQALQAAEAGLDYAQAYLIAQGPSGISDGQTFTDTLANSCSYSVQISYLNGTNEQIQIVSTGTSADGTVNKTFSEKSILIGGAGAIGFEQPVKATGSVSVTGNVDIIVNLVTDKTIHSGAAVTLGGSSQTVIPSGVGSDSSGLGADIVQNDAVLAATSDADLFQSHFGTSFANALSPGAVTQTYSGGGSYGGTLNGITGEVIEINAAGSSVSLDGSGTIGSAASPVTLIINASDVSLSSNLVVYGDIIVSGNLSSAGNYRGSVNGDIKVGGDIQLTGNADFNGDVLSDGALQIAGNSQIVGVVYAADGAQISGNSTINGAILLGDALIMSGNSVILYDQNAVSGWTGGGGTEYTRMLGSWKSF
jgi:Tfp pilus assembly protein PilX/cytoskeletal protein CcmA (bactofilin family)